MPFGTDNDVTFLATLFFSQGLPDAVCRREFCRTHPVTTMPIVQDIGQLAIWDVTHARSRYLPLLASYWPFGGLIQSLPAQVFSRGGRFEERR